MPGPGGLLNCASMLCARVGCGRRQNPQSVRAGVGVQRLHANPIDKPISEHSLGTAVLGYRFARRYRRGLRAPTRRVGLRPMHWHLCGDDTAAARLRRTRPGERTAGCDLFSARRPTLRPGRRSRAAAPRAQPRDHPRRSPTALGGALHGLRCRFAAGSTRPTKPPQKPQERREHAPALQPLTGETAIRRPPQARRQAANSRRTLGELEGPAWDRASRCRCGACR